MDKARLLQIHDWCDQHGFDITPLVRDEVDLNCGRDFLMEEKKYEVVVLHFLFRGGLGIFNNGGSKGQRNTVPQLRYSTEANWVSWVHRLRRSEARLIFAFGGLHEVSGDYLNNIADYSRKIFSVRMAYGDFTVFQRETVVENVLSNTPTYAAHV